MKLFWACTRENNLILTFDLRHQLEDENGKEIKNGIFNRIVNEKNVEAFKPYQLFTKELIASGIFGGESIRKEISLLYSQTKLKLVKKM